jgi:PAS domain S-box-containing protein
MNKTDDIFNVLEQDDKFRDVMKRLMEMSMALSFNGIVVTTAEPGYPIVYANAAFCEMTGYTPEEVMAKSPSMLQGPLTDSEVLDRLSRDIAADRIFHGRAVNYRKDGSTFLMEWKIIPVHNNSGQTTHYLAIQRDVTAAKTGADA